MGDGTASGSWYDQIQVVNTTTGQTLVSTNQTYSSNSISSGNSTARSYIFSLPNGTAGVGQLQVTVTTDAGDSIFEYNSSGTAYTNNSASVTVASTLAPYPDLQVTGLAVTPGSPQSGQQVTVNWNDANTGNGTASGSWYDQIQVVNTTTGQTLVSTNQTYGSNSISAGGSTARSYSFSLANGTAGVGQLQVTVTTDAGDSIFEYNSSGTAYTNNSASVTVTSTLAPYPDLQVTGLAVTPSSPQSGQQVTVNWNDANTGNGTASGTWYDQIQVVNTTTGQTLVSTNQTYGSNSISAGGSTARSYSFSLPNGTAGVGQLQVTVTTDAGDSIFEYNSSGTAYTNNTASLAVASTLAPYPDLQVTGLAVTPGSPQSGQQVTINWNDANTGNGTASGSWYDQIQAVNTTTGQTLVSTNQTYGSNSISAGSSMARSYSFSLPNGSAGVGQLQVTVTTDAGDGIFEYNSSGTAYTNNTANITATSTLAAYPDLHATGLAVDPSSVLQSGGTVMLDWNDSNVGDATASGSWQDQITVVNATTGQTLLNTIPAYGSNSISAGASAARSYSFSLPTGAAGVGQLSITVTADAGGSLLDYNSSGTLDTNRSASITAQTTLGAYPDLHAAALAVDPSSVLQSGGTVTLDWNDSNVGDATASGTWYDHVTVVNTTTGQTFANTDPSYSGNSISAGGSTARSYSFSLPTGAAGVGQLSITVTADAGGSLLDYNSSGTIDTNRSANLTAQTTLGAYPDLHAATLAVDASSVLQSGGTVTLDWNDSNVGSATASGSWYDQVTVVNTTTGQTLVNSGQTYSSNSISAGGSSARSYSFSLPNGSPGVGQLSITVMADAGGSLLDYNSNGTIDSNRSANITAQSTLAPSPQLAVESVAGPADAAAGQMASVAWTLANAGNAAANGEWSEQVFYGTDATGDNLTLLTSSTYSSPLAVGASVPRSALVGIPASVVGEIWFVVKEDADGGVFENDTATSTGVAAQATNVPVGLTLSLASQTVLKNAGAAATTATVTRGGDTSQPLSVAIADSNTNDTSVPTAVTIPAGRNSATFPVGTIDDGLVDGNQTVTLTASASGYASGSNTLNVQETDLATLTLTISSLTFSENAGSNAATATLTRNAGLSSPLVIALTSNNTNKLTVPPTVTIPAGQTSLTFPLTAVNDQHIDGPTSVKVSASSTGFVGASESVTVTDANCPTLSLSLADQTVSEAAGSSATTGVVTVPTALKVPLTISLSSGDTTAATVPPHVVIPAGQTSATFAIAAVDDGLDDANKTAVITAQVETEAGVILTQGAAIAALVVVNADGPALSVAFPSSAVEKGAEITATVTRNTATTSELVVDLASSDDTKATVPQTVDIPTGQASATFIVTTIDDHTPDGLQHVQITASAPTFASAIVPLGITDVDLPDLVVSSVTAPASGYDNAPLDISWTITNSGKYPASGSWLDEVFLDPVGGPQSSTPADTIAYNGVVNAGQSYTRTDSLQFPATVGQYVVRVVTDSNQNIQELSFANNSGVSPTINDQATYHATVSTTVTTVPNGTPVPLSGLATLTSNGHPAANVPVAVQIMVGGTTRTLTATTDATGHYSLTFQPLPNEAGDYSVAADDPGVANPAVQAHFQILGMSASPSSANVTLVPDTPLSGQFTLTNLNNVTLTGLSAAASGGPAGLTVQLTPPTTIAADGTATLAYSLDATAAQAATGVVTIQVTSAQGTVLDILLSVSVVPLTPKLAANPGSLDTGMLVGNQSVLTFAVTNNGGAPSGDLQVSLPSTSYMTLGSPATIPSLAPGASSTVTIELDPPANLPLEQYAGTIGIGNSQTGISVPFTFRATTSETGSVYVLVDDDYTFDEAGAPHVQGATVTLLDPYDNTQVIATGVTDATGAVTLTNIPAGPYALQVTAPEHSNYQSSFTVLPGITNDDEVFIARQFVSYTWVVAQTTIQDTYQIQLQTNFQTNVPAPVVTITAPSAIPTLSPGQSGSFNVTITNHGLIAAQNVSLNLPTDPEYTFTALSDQIGVVPAGSSVTVPITVTRSAPQPMSTDYAGGGVLTTKVEVPNPIGYHTESTLYVDYANTGTAPMPAPLLVLTAAQIDDWGAPAVEADDITPDASATQNGYEGAWLTLNPNLEASGYNTSGVPAGFSQSVEILASGATPGILAPGESEQVPVYYVGWNSFPAGMLEGVTVEPISTWTPAAPVDFSLTTISANDTTSANWSSLLAASQPPSINAAAWSTISANLQAQLGSTSGSYVQLLDNEAAYLGTLGENITDAGALWGFAVQQADNDLNPVGPYLATATDDFAAYARQPVVEFQPGLRLDDLRPRYDGPFGHGLVIQLADLGERRFGRHGDHLRTG